MSDRMTQDELLATLNERFGPRWQDWAFVCPNCGDIATGADFRKALDESNRPAANVSHFLGQQCIGRVLGALSTKMASQYKGRGCDWCAFGLFRGPVIVDLGDGKTMGSFRIAEKGAKNPEPEPAEPEIPEGEYPFKLGHSALDRSRPPVTAGFWKKCTG